jgi:hypothetical protein
MTFQEKLQSKLQPHAERIKDGTNDDFDYLPAVLHHLIEEQGKQSQILSEVIAVAKTDLLDQVNFARKEINEGMTEIRSDIGANLDLIRGDVKNGVNSLNEAILTNINSVREELQRGIQAINLGGEKQSEAILFSLNELSTALSEEGKKNKRLLLALFGVGMLALSGVVALVVTYVGAR